MAEEEKTPTAPTPPPPHHLYQPAKTDVRIVVQFIGNTAEVAEMKFLGASPGHMMAAAKRLEFYANQAWAIQEHRQRTMGVQVTDKMPPQGMRPGDIATP